MGERERGASTLYVDPFHRYTYIDSKRAIIAASRSNQCFVGLGTQKQTFLLTSQEHSNIAPRAQVPSASKKRLPSPGAYTALRAGGGGTASSGSSPSSLPSSSSPASASAACWSSSAADVSPPASSGDSTADCAGRFLKVYHRMGKSRISKDCSSRRKNHPGKTKHRMSFTFALEMCGNWFLWTGGKRFFCESHVDTSLPGSSRRRRDGHRTGLFPPPLPRCRSP